MAAQVFAVKRVRDEDGSLSLVDLGLKGITCQNLRNGLAQFSALKFLTTSYYHDVSSQLTSHRVNPSTSSSVFSSAVLRTRMNCTS